VAATVSARTVNYGEVLWQPEAAFVESLQITKYMRWLDAHRNLRFENYDELWSWSVDDLEGFWESIAEFFDVRMHTRHDRVLVGDMPRTRWFPGATLNYAEHVLRRRGPAPALIGLSQTRDGTVTITYDELWDDVARVAAGLKTRGLTRGDAVAAYLPNIPEAVILFLACASMGVAFSSCAMEFGTGLVVDRFSQLEPKLLVAADGYRFRGRQIDRRNVVELLAAELPSLEHVVVLPYLFHDACRPDVETWADLTASTAELTFEPVEFDHPLYVLYSSGTTGPPKSFVHAHGRMLLEHLKALGLHLDVHPGDRLLQPTTTGWMLWNFGVSVLLLGAALVCFDGDPLHPDSLEIWRAASHSGATILNAGSGVLLATMRDGYRPGEVLDLDALRTVSATGSPFPPQGFAWLYDAVGSDLFFTSGSGGTDVCTGFVGGLPLLPVTAGEMSCRYLGAALESFDINGHPVRDVDGELVLTRPMPSMPVCFLRDTDFTRYTKSYFDQYPGVWRHGDWVRITGDGRSVISGRSDATLKRAGVRIGTSEIYAVLDQLDDIDDAVVVHLDDADRDLLVLLVATALPETGHERLQALIRRTLHTQMSPRHVPDRIFCVRTLPRTLTGKRLEIPIKRILAGAEPADVLDLDSISEPDAVVVVAALAPALANLTPPPVNEEGRS
jgi:acetoacetyl-CoA synthetase